MGEPDLLGVGSAASLPLHGPPALPARRRQPVSCPMGGNSSRDKPAVLLAVAGLALHPSPTPWGAREQALPRLPPSLRVCGVHVDAEK